MPVDDTVPTDAPAPANGNGPHPSAVFVAATEGDTGKSTVALGLLRILAGTVQRVGVFRPVTVARRNGDTVDVHDRILDMLLQHSTADLEYEDCIGVTNIRVHEDRDAALAEMYDGEYGLSYSTFQYRNLIVNKQYDLDTAIQTPIKYVADAPGGDARLYDIAAVASFDIENKGPYPGTEIPQLYLLPPAEAGNPTKILRGFDNVQIRDGETQRVYLYLTRKDISYWSVLEQTWVTPKGEFRVFVGASANETRLTGSFTV